MNLNLGDTQAIIAVAKRMQLLRNELAYVLATAYHETRFTIKPVREAYWLSEAWRAENLRYYPWYGRGYVQLTWEDNYDRADSKLGLAGTLVADPDRALEIDIAAEVIVVGMKEGWFTGKKLSDYITLQKSDFVNARRIVNGTDQAANIAGYAESYDADLKAYGYGEEDDETEPAPSLTQLAEAMKVMAEVNARQSKQIRSLNKRIKALEGK